MSIESIDIQKINPQDSNPRKVNQAENKDQDQQKKQFLRDLKKEEEKNNKEEEKAENGVKTAGKKIVSNNLN